ncbi:erythrocyte membrane protein 1 [Plasmodium falciparum IGH-CR14]|uniref:Erythrocyte membrane protein 1 n=2 Tax=Plasmodium falciparum TaxID=5833 RepID=A0A0L1I4K4_PLAFA|nr:erythrocyte membrane protein 1 [Plasmodium falciparum IGH-CR14]
MAPAGSNTQDASAKHMFDRIGKKVHDEVKEEADGTAKKYIEELKGNLQAAKGMGETANSLNPCTLVEEYRRKNTGTADARGERQPCKKDGTGNDVDRFSVKQQAEYDNKKMKCSNGSNGSNGKNEGACASFRRLNLCNKNMENMDTNNNDGKAKHNLLAEVCMAAKYEGESLITYHDQHQITYPGYHSQICTELARSFADIGDIVRGKDLYGGNNKRRQQLEKNLKTIFEKIKGNNNSTLKGLSIDEVREYWWALNRKEVWKAITCKADASSAYFHATCDTGKGPSVAQKQCRCDKDKGAKDGDQVPTYFDYVPQFLRWFEEWAEDFCRKKKKQLPHLKTNCRGPSGNDKYCSRNGCDCEKTVRAKGKLRYGNRCTDCLYACYPYVDWIDNQKEQFLKQKNKYADEINGASGTRRLRRAARSSNSDDNGYEKIFYKKLKDSGYESVGEFLDLLSKEEVCKNFKEKEEGKIDFKNVHSGSASGDGASGTNDINNGTFSHSEYCQPCPYCGMKRAKGGNFEKKRQNDDCHGQKLYKPKGDATPTDVTILKSGEGHEDIKQKIDEFCNQTSGSSGAVNAVAGSNSRSKELYQEWKCYKGKDVVKVENKDEEEDEEDYRNIQTGGGLCILKKEEEEKKEVKKTNSEKEPKEIQKTYNDFFNFWVAHMLKDSIYWRTKRLSKCINNGKKECIKNCNDKCKCYKNWVDKKEKEWDKIKKHFDTQEDIIEQTKSDAGVTLEWVLELQFLNEHSTQDKQNSLDAQELKHLKEIKKILDEEKQKSEAAGGASDGKKKTIMDKLIEHELTDAKECLEKQEECKKAEEDRSAARIIIGKQQPRSEDEPEKNYPDDNADEDGDEDAEDDSSEDEDNDGDVAEEKATEKEVPSPTQDTVDVCDTVAKALTGDDLQKACPTKYGSKAPTSWKCITSGEKSGDKDGAGPSRSKRGAETSGPSGSSGATCIPPRRRRLYVGKLQEWATIAESKLESTSSPSNSRDVDLLKAFVESAAVETFFLWDRYKKIKEKERQEELQRNGEVVGLPLLRQDVSQEDDPEQKKLNDGTIPEEFKRQMFYTLGDYKDILFSGSKDDNTKSSTYNDILKGDKVIQERESKIQEQLKSFFSNSGKGQPSDKKSASDKDPKEWWQTNGEHIWNGMICALTHKTDKPPQVDTTVRAQLWDEEGKKPQKHQYEYKNVKLEENSGTDGPKLTTQPPASGEKNSTPTTKLSDFVLRPPYFRYLEEWGETFCKERKKRLEEVKKECEVGEKGNRGCSGDGLKCDEPVPKNEEIFEDFHCSKCAKPCRKYRKWIERKKIEFHKQSNAYKQQKEKCKTESNGAAPNNGGNTFCGKLKDDAAKFLKTLTSCSKTNNGDDDINFNDKDGETFKHTKHCDPCSKFKIKCENCNSSGDDTKGKCDGKTDISANDIKNKENSTEEIVMLVSDDSATGFGDLKDCENAGIFKGIKENKWKCGEFCGVHICKRENEGDEKYIIMKELLQRWLEIFFEDYNKINKKLKTCIENGKGTKCIKDCVNQWIKKKKKEWNNINDNYLKKYTEKNPDGNNLTNFLEILISQIPVVTDKGKHASLDALENSLGCKCYDSSGKEKRKYNDVIQCLLTKLEEKAKKCAENHKPSGETEKSCVDYPPLPDDDEPLEETENPVIHPKICGDIPTTKETVVEKETCDAPDAPQPDVKEEEEEKEEEKDKGEAPGPLPPPAAPQPPSQPTPKIVDKTPALVTSTLAWSVGIGFATFTYFYLKKKTKASVGNLFQILQIPKGDHDIPTKLSPNRYIPYTSGKYRGKRYIYLEGDSGTDSGYTDHYSDITSSESEYEELDINDIYAPREYEELDINDIYVPHAPKYKTLIEVVLEPSKRDTQNDIPSDIPNSDTPPPITDDEWNKLKKDFISNMLQNTQNTEPNILRDNVDNNTHPTTSHHNVEEKPFIMSIHDRNLFSGEEYNYDMFNSGNNPINISDSTNSMDSLTSNNHSPYNDKNDLYSGIDLINDALSGNHIDIYDEMLKRKENELFGTKHHTKHTNTYNVAKPARDDPITNQINLFHKWLDRHRYMCAKLKNKEDILNKLKEEWNKENNNNSAKTYNSDNKPSGNKTLNTDVSIQIHMDNPKPKNEFKNMDTTPNKSTMDTMLDDLEKYNEPYYYDFYKDDIYYDVNDDDKTSMDNNNNLVDKNNPVDSNNSTYNHRNPADINKNFVDKNNQNQHPIEKPTKIQIEMNSNNREVVEQQYPIADIWNI